MDVSVFQAVITAISTVGFPMAVAVHYMTIGYKRTKEHTEVLKAHTESVNGMKSALENLIQTINFLRKDNHGN